MFKENKKSVIARNGILEKAKELSIREYLIKTEDKIRKEIDNQKRIKLEK